MHGYYRNPKKLEGLLFQFLWGGQCEIESEDELFRGLLRTFRVSHKEKRVTFIFDWLCVREIGCTASFLKRIVWRPVPSRTMPLHTLNFGYTSYYYQDGKKRVKLYGQMKNEFCRVFRPDDPTNLFVEHGEVLQKIATIEFK